MNQVRKFDHLTESGERQVVYLEPFCAEIHKDHSGRPLMEMLSTMTYVYQHKLLGLQPSDNYHEAVRQIIALLLTHVFSEGTIGQITLLSIVPSVEGSPFTVHFAHRWKEVHVTGRHYFRQLVTLSLV